MQHETNRKEVNNLRSERSVQTKIVHRKSERSGQQVIIQKTELLKQKSNNILKVQDNESTNSNRIRNSEKDIEMHKDDHDIESSDDHDIGNSDGRRCNNESTNSNRIRNPEKNIDMHKDDHDIRKL